MTHIYVIAGHGAGDSGACGNGYQEAERVRALAQCIKDLGGDNVTLHPLADNAYASNAISRLDIPKDWQIVELHMDSAAASARGAHVIYYGKYSPDVYDKALADFVANMFPGRADKLVARIDLANPKQGLRLPARGERVHQQRGRHCRLQQPLGRTCQRLPARIRHYELTLTQPVLFTAERDGVRVGAGTVYSAAESAAPRR